MVKILIKIKCQLTLYNKLAFLAYEHIWSLIRLLIYICKKSFKSEQDGLNHYKIYGIKLDVKLKVHRLNSDKLNV